MSLSHDIKMLHLISSLKYDKFEKHIEILGGSTIFLGYKILEVDDLNGYDIIICSGGSSSINNVITGDILCDYIKKGGKCISMRASNQKTLANSSYCIKGNFPHAFEEGPGPFTKDYKQNNNVHPIMLGIKDFTTSYSISTQNTTENSIIIAKWRDNDILAAEKEVGLGKIISLSFGYHCMKDQEVNIIRNAINYLICDEWNINTHHKFSTEFKKIVIFILFIFKYLRIKKNINVSKDIIRYIITTLNRMNKQPIIHK